MTEKGSSSSDLGPNESEGEIVKNLQTKLNNFEIEFNEEKEKNEKEKKLIESKNKKEMEIFEKKMNEEIQKVKSEQENEIKNLKEYFQQLIDEKITEIKTIEKQKIGESMSEIKKFGGMDFIQVKNKWSLTANNCENADKNGVPVGICIEENEFVNLIGDGNIKYILGKGEDKSVVVFAENEFKNPKEKNNYSLFYYEVKGKIEEEENKNILCVGIKNCGNDDVLLCIGKPIRNKLAASIVYKQKNKKKGINLPETFCWNDGDVFGCGVVYPPINRKNKFPFVFFTQNGKQIGKGILMKGRKNDESVPSLLLGRCSVETNFGNNLEIKPFLFDISKNSVLDEFYEDSKDEADSDSSSDSDDSDIDTMGEMMLGMMLAGAATRAMARMFTDTVEN
uniref:Uncharacterized protein n=1 Tax=Meloidogyne enterolobii TaxID=390850 RepID=A0A6V7TZR7_MELEN|nr:unnamed protein product [Meloidogyne enterolobii]